MNSYIKGNISKGEFVSQLFKQRVESIGGTYEANDCLVNSLNSLTDKEFKDAKLILTPNGYVVDKLPTIKPNGGGDATIVRNVVKTRVNSSGLIESMAANVLAPDYLNGVCPALNVEGQATNLLSYSEQFDNAYWFKDGTSFVLSSDNFNTNVFNLKELSGISLHNFVSSQEPILGSAVYTASIFAKQVNAGRFFLFSIETDFQNFATFGVDLSNGNVLTKNYIFGYTLASCKTYEVDNGWYKITVTATTPPGATTTSLRCGYSNLSTWSNIGRGFPSYAGTDTIFVLITGAQLEQGEDTSYIPTTTAQVTRSADTVTVPIPAGTTEIIEKYEDGTTNTITTIPASPYTVPVGRYEYILMR